MPVLTAGLLLGGMVIFIVNRFFSLPIEKTLVVIGGGVFLAGLIVAFVGMLWSIWTLTSPAMRKARGITTPVVTILIAVFAWSGTMVTLYKFKKSHDVRVETKANEAAMDAQEVTHVAAH